MKINKTIRKLKKYIIRNFADIILIEIPVIVFFVISVLLLKYGLSINPSVKLQDTFSVIFLLFVPVIIFIIFKCLKLMKKKILSIIVNILSFILIPVSLFFYIYFSGAIYVASLFNAEFTYRTPSVSEYSTEIKKLSENEYRTNHFPSKIPQNAQDYYFRIYDTNLHEYCISYLKFNIDKEYLNNVIKQNEDEIYRKLPLIKISEYYKDFDLIGDIPVTNKNNYTAYILKNENNDYNYTSGFIVSKDLQEIIYFYSDFNLEDLENKIKN